jgi:hypothetical protein
MFYKYKQFFRHLQECYASDDIFWELEQPSSNWLCDSKHTICVDASYLQKFKKLFIHSLSEGAQRQLSFATWYEAQRLEIIATSADAIRVHHCYSADADVPGAAL